MYTDKISQLIIGIKNASMAGRPEAMVPASKFKKNILQLLKSEGYIADYEQTEVDGKPFFKITIAYKADGNPRVSDVKRMSKPSVRMYKGYKQCKPVKFGHGMMVLSTPAGVISDRQARADQVGGEALFAIW